MIHILAGITSIQIRAKYTTLDKESVFFHEAELQFAVDGAIDDDAYTVSAVPAMFVELCNCPPEYEGNFCEQCAPGYRWQSTDLGPVAGCVICNCNGHSDGACDQETGACQDCQHNTAGDTCQLCQDGYYGDATRGTPDDCQPCMCPGPPGENSFSPTCDGNGVCLQCAEGHEGNNCETCSTGYYGLPTDIQMNGGQCQPCFCSLSPAVCDSISGQCLDCQGNTGGLTCDVCDNGYWGNIANCQECDCDPVGGDGNCTQDQGICECHPNVIGNRCTQCAPVSWGFNTGEAGCTLCDCHPIGTVFGASQCNLETGQCECKERVTGLKCDACVDGYYSVEQGCIPCECSSEGTLASTCDAQGVCSCNVTTGQCTCMLDTIAGRTCDRCGRVGDDMMNVVEEVFVGAYPNCDPCPECYQNWRRTLLDLGENFEAQEQNLMNLMQNYGDLAVSEVDMYLGNIRGNLSYAERAIQEGTEEAGDLEAIQSGFDAITSGVFLMSSLIADIESQVNNLTLLAEDIKSYDGMVMVEPGLTRNAAQLQQELDSLVNTRETYYSLAEESWTTIQEMYQLVENQEIQVQTLQTLTEKLLDDTERAANDRRDARSIIVNSQRDTEFGENFQRLQQINTIYEAYPLNQASNLAILAESNVNSANLTVQSAKLLAGQKKTEAEAKKYDSEVAKFNATSAEVAANNARTAATTYKDVALSSAGDMAWSYLTVLDVNSRLSRTNTRRTEIETLGNEVQNIQLRPAAEMTTLVEQINALNVDGNAQTYFDDSAAGLQTAEETRNTSQLAQMESSSVEALKNTIEYELTQAETVRGNTVTSLDTSDGYVENINNVAQQVMRRGEEATNQGRSTSDIISEIRQSAQNNDQCLISKRNQAENARDRAQGAKLQAEAAQQEYLTSINDQQVLRNMISSEMNAKAAAFNDVNTVSYSANNLYDDVITTKQMEDLDALITQYIRQRNDMQILSTQLSEMENHLDAILTNLDGATDGSLQCNEPSN
ncbi:uncharacterized protein [Amphiura filiformis]|uniref:uncharacterized protein n=1 Tax=Amphiura filiformis TaxID=82378 RepID=UPI003B20C12A